MQIPAIRSTSNTVTNERKAISPVILTKEFAVQDPQSEPMLTLEQAQQEEEKATREGEKDLVKDVGKQYQLGLLKSLFIKLTMRTSFEPELRKSLTVSAGKLFVGCANNFNFMALHKEFGMKDNFFSWYQLTLLHIWMALARMQQSMEANCFCLYRHEVCTAFHKDVEIRYKKAYDDTNSRHKRQKRLLQLYHGVFMHTFLELDEGFLHDDQHFAGSIWRSIFMYDQHLDIIHLNRAVRYIRATVHFLDGLDAEKLLADGIDIWEPAEEIWREHQERIK